MQRFWTGSCVLGKRAILLFTAVSLCGGALDAAIIRGTVSSTHGTLQNMVVSAWSPSGTIQASAGTDSNGNYEMPLPGGQYRFLAYDPRGVWATTFDGGADSFDTTPTVNVLASSVIIRNFQLVKAGTIQGTVRAGNLVQSGITIAVYNLSGTLRGWTRTDPYGRYSVALPPGPFKVAAWDDRRVLATIFFPAAASFDDAAVLTVVSGNTIPARDFSMSPFARLLGTIFDASTGTPLDAVMAYAYTSDGGRVTSTTTGTDGTFELDVPGGTYRLLAADPLDVYATAYYGGVATFLDTPEVSADSAQSVGGLDIDMTRGGGISGQVTTGTGITMGGAHVVGYNRDGTPRAETTASATGGYHLVLPPGTFRIAAFDMQLVFAPQFYDETPVFSVASPILIDAGASVPGVDFVLSRAGKVTGTVRDAETRAPVQGIIVSAWDENGFQIASSTTDFFGSYAIALGPGSYRFITWDPSRVYASGFAGEATDFESTPQQLVVAGVSVVSNFEIVPGVPVTGRCITEDGNPVGGIDVIALDVEGNHVARTTSAADGTFDLALAPGRYKLGMHDPEGRYLDDFFDRAQDLAQASVIEVVQGQTPPPTDLVVGPSAGRRHPVDRP